VYDFTDFVEEHPGGASSIEDIGGKDGTGAFQAIHSPAMLEDFTPIGKFSPL
jgi:cytochrome b involved in lipid metabolism